MMIRNITNIKNVALAVAAFALAVPAANAQQRVYNSATGRTTITNNSQMVNNLINNSNGYSSSNFGYGGYLNNYGGFIVGGDPYEGIFGDGYGYRLPGAVIMGSNGQVVDTTPYPYADNGVEDQSVAAQSQGGGSIIPAAQLNDQIAAIRLADNRVKISWAGDPRPIASMTFSLLDRRRNEVRHTDVSSIPAQAIFTRPSNAVYYRVTITYSDGAVRSLIGSL